LRSPVKTPTLLPTDPTERALFCCKAAARHEERGHYARAVESLDPFWDGPGSEFKPGRLTTEAHATLLLRAGSLTGWLGSQRQFAGWQEQAKDLLSESAGLFARIGFMERYAEALRHMGICYWREGPFEKARLIFQQALDITGGQTDDWLSLKLNDALVEYSEGKYQDCLDSHAKLASTIEGRNDSLKGRFHNGRGIALNRLGRTGLAIVELRAAADHFRRSGHERFQIASENNLSNLFILTKRFDEAHSSMDRAEALAEKLGDKAHLAQAKDSRALAWLAQKNYVDAEQAATLSVGILEKGDEHALLVESLVTQARALSGLERRSAALGTYLRAYELAADRVGGGRAARVVLEALSELAGEACLTGHVTIEDAKRVFEEGIIRKALKECDGKSKAAAMRLGLIPQTLSWILQSRHPDLRPNPKRKRRRVSIVKRSDKKQRKS